MKQKQKLAFCFMPKMRRGVDGIAKAMKLLLLLLASGLASVPAHSNCYQTANLGQFLAGEFTGVNECRPNGVGGIFYEISDQYELFNRYESYKRACANNVDEVWNCPVYAEYPPNTINQLRNRWKADVKRCRAYFTREFNKYNGRMCN